jgi:(1->4)-alpha-D-glucan 1-alpha-D-glucosylmutase
VKFLEKLRYLEQLSPSVMANGVKDTLSYYYNALASQNKVGGAPWSNGISCAEFHVRNAEREAFHPRAMITTSTHDTKLSEDVRARINSLTLIPEKWEAKLKEWEEVNKSTTCRGTTSTAFTKLC